MTVAMGGIHCVGSHRGLPSLRSCTLFMFAVFSLNTFSGLQQSTRRPKGVILPPLSSTFLPIYFDQQNLHRPNHNQRHLDQRYQNRQHRIHPHPHNNIPTMCHRIAYFHVRCGHYDQGKNGKNMLWRRTCSEGRCEDAPTERKQSLDGVHRARRSIPSLSQR